MASSPAAEATSGSADSLLDILPAPCMRAVLLSLWGDPRDLASFGCVSTAAAQLVREDNQLWQEVLLLRYGPTALPGAPQPAESTRPVQLEGWTFCPGLDASPEGEEAAQPSVPASSTASVAQLAERCTAKGAEAFTTAGKLITRLPPRDSWRRTSYRPFEGTYVQQDVAAAVVDADESGASSSSGEQQQGAWPPVVPGWVFFPSCDSPGYFRSEAKDNRRTHSSLLALLRSADRDAHVVAVTSAGETKSKLRPQHCWRSLPAYDQGLFVKQSVATSMGLVVPPPAPDYRALAARLHSQGLKQPAGQMDAVWLNDRYLTLQDDQRHSTVLKLNAVWWLDIAGSITGVAPGTYEVVWLMATGDAHSFEYPVFSLSATAHALGLPTPPAFTPAAAASAGQAGSSGNRRSARLATRLQGMQAAAGAAAGAVAGAVAGAIAGAGAGAAAVAGAAGAGAGASSSSVSRSLSHEAMVAEWMTWRANSVGHGWGRLSGGRITVSETSRVDLRFWSHQGYKTGMYWAYVELRPVLTAAHQQHEQQRRQQCRDWWDRHNQQQQRGGARGVLSALADSVGQLAQRLQGS